MSLSLFVPAILQNIMCVFIVRPEGRTDSGLRERMRNLKLWQSVKTGEDMRSHGVNAGVGADAGGLMASKKDYVLFRANSTAACACIVMVSKTGTFTSSCLINNGISVHPKMTPSAPSSTR